MNDECENSRSEVIDPVVERVCRLWPLNNWIGSTVVVAVSGGPDSVALFRLLLRSKLRAAESLDSIKIAHVNHNTRANARNDREFVMELGERFGVDVIVIEREPLQDNCIDNGNSEESLRNFRYDAILEIARQIGARYIATGHNANDQIETVLFRILRGTGLQGLKGIPVVRVSEDISIVRPLLTTRRSVILELLQAMNQPYCVDESNLSSAYTRNFIRNEVIPLLNKRFAGQFENSILRIAAQSIQYAELLDELTDPLVSRAETDANGMIKLPRAVLRDAPSAVIRHALTRIWKEAGFAERSMTQEKWQALADLIVAEESRQIQLPGNVTAAIDSGCLVLTKL